jgi:hypothetical protein
MRRSCAPKCWLVTLARRASEETVILPRLVRRASVGGSRFADTYLAVYPLSRRGSLDTVVAASINNCMVLGFDSPLNELVCG